MPDGGGLLALKKMREVDPQAKAILFTSYGSEEEVCQAMQAGACGYLHKNEGSEAVLSAIRAVHAGGAWIPERVESLQKDRLGRPMLTAREVEVLELIFEGHSNKQIAFTLAVAENTIKNHINNLMVKLHARDRTHAANLALKRGLILLESEKI
jgi:two-component system NarL family response regulator